MEGDILDTAAQVIAGAPFQVKSYGVADDSAWEVGLPCGGEIAVMVQPVSAEGFDPELFDRIAEARDDGRALTVTTDLATGHSDLRPLETGEVFAFSPQDGQFLPLREVSPVETQGRNMVELSFPAP